VGSILVVTSVPATALLYELDDEFPGGTDPANDPPWLTATIEDIAINTVRLTMKTEGLTNQEFVSEWYFNWNFDFSIPSAVDIGAGTTGPIPGPFWSEDFYNVGGGATFDVLFDFPVPNNPSDPSEDRFEAGEIVILELMGTGLTASAFDVKDVSDRFYTAAHVQGIGENAQFSGKIGATVPIPEPGTFLLLGAGLASLFGIRRFELKK